MKILIVILIAFSLFSCTNSSNKITSSIEYLPYINSVDALEIENIETNKYFWKNKLANAPNQHPYKIKLASVNSKLFAKTGKLSYLKMAEQQYLDANKSTAYSNASYLRALASNYITQHKFSAALELLNKAEVVGEKLTSTHLLLFDVHLELGNVKAAENYLNKFNDYTGFEHLIRFAKWNDYNGNLDDAIKFLEQAKYIAEKNKDHTLMQWSYTNLADFYGHANKIEDSYTHYLKALKLNSNNAYAKKGIAWIVYSYERKPEDALRILNTIEEQHVSPDYYLLKADIAEYIGDQKLRNKNMDVFYEIVSGDSVYSNLYNKQLIDYYLFEAQNFEKAKILAQKDIKQRPHPQAYSTLAWVYYHMGNTDYAKELMDEHVKDKFHEPESIYYMTKIYSSQKEDYRLKAYKEELLGSLYELGPQFEEKISSL